MTDVFQSFREAADMAKTSPFVIQILVVSAGFYIKGGFVDDIGRFYKIDPVLVTFNDIFDRPTALARRGK